MYLFKVLRRQIIRIITQPAWMHLRCISETSLGRLIRDISSETSLRSLKLSQRRLWAASEAVILGLQTKAFYGNLFVYLRVFKHFVKLIWNCWELGLSWQFIWDTYIRENLFRPNGSSTFPLSFLDSIISRILTFSCTLLGIRRLSRKTTVVAFPLTTATQRKIPFKRYHKKFH